MKSPFFYVCLNVDGCYWSSDWCLPPFGVMICSHRCFLFVIFGLWIRSVNILGDEMCYEMSVSWHRVWSDYSLYFHYKSSLRTSFSTCLDPQYSMTPDGDANYQENSLLTPTSKTSFSRIFLSPISRTLMLGQFFWIASENLFRDGVTATSHQSICRSFTDSTDTIRSSLTVSGLMVIPSKAY